MTATASSRPTLVLIHAFPLDAAMWGPQRDALDGIDLFLPDLPGFGEQPGLDEESLSMERAALFIEGELKSRGISRCVIGGVSMGGYVALACWRAFGPRIAGLVLADTRATADTAEVRAGRMAALERIGSGRYDEYCDTLLQKLLAESTRRSRPEIVANVRAIMKRTHPEAASSAILGMLERPDSSDLLATIGVPTAVIVGEHDAITSVDEARAMSEAIPGATLHVIENAGHLSNLENPDAFNDAVRGLYARFDS